jgi:DNA-binding protein YbaB
MAEADDADFDQLLYDARRRLNAVRAGTAASHDDTPARGTGEALDGQVTVVASRGRLESVELSPQTMRNSADELRGPLLAAVNAALDGLRAQAPSAADGAIDPEALAERLREVRDQSMRSMEMISNALGDAVARVSQRTGMTGGTGSQGLEFLLDELRDNLDAARFSGTDQADLQGEGLAADGRVHAVTVPGGRVMTLDLGPRTMRMASQDLAEGVRDAVNAALDDLEAKAREQVGFAGIDPEKIFAVQKMSLQHMTAYTRSLRDLMSSIQEP